MEAGPAASPTLYPRLLGSQWPTLGAAVRSLHLLPGGGTLRASGCFRVRWGRSPAAAALARLLRLPRPADRVPTSLSVASGGDGELWRRVFGDRELSTLQQDGGDGLLVERLGWLELRFRLVVSGPALRYEPAGAALRFGPWAVALPRPLAPTVHAGEAPGDGEKTCVSVEVTLPVVGLLLSYDGWMRPEERAAR